MPSKEVVEKTKIKHKREPKRKVQETSRAPEPKGILKKQGAGRTSRSSSIKWRLKQNKTKYFSKDDA
jgi:hypothetical protein